MATNMHFHKHLVFLVKPVILKHISGMLMADTLLSIMSKSG